MVKGDVMKVKKKMKPRSSGTPKKVEKKPVPKAATSIKKKSTEKSAPQAATGIKKQYLKSNGTCNVTFKLPKEAAQNARIVTIVGDFNNWNRTESEMQKLKSGDFKITLKLPASKEYRFRYLIDSIRWENDWHADNYVANEFGCEDSLVIV